jgi:hypothetical protein
VFAAGAVSLGLFVLGLKTGWSLRSDEPSPVEGGPASDRMYPTQA